MGGYGESDLHKGRDHMSKLLCSQDNGTPFEYLGGGGTKIPAEKICMGWPI